MESQVSFRVRQAFRDELAKFAAQEKRTLGNLGELILEWGFEQLKAVGSTHRLLKCKFQVAPARRRARESCASMALLESRVRDRNPALSASSNPFQRSASPVFEPFLCFLGRRR